MCALTEYTMSVY